MKTRKIILALVALVALFGAASTASAQLATGTIAGTITDQQGAVLPGVTVTAQGVDATQTFTTESDGRYRFLNLAPGPYKITAALSGFTTIVRQNVIVEVGKNVELPIQLKLASVEETVTVSGESPIIDVKETGTSTNFTNAELDRVPTSRDPWALLRTVPGVLVDRVNIGGNETGQQSNFQAKATRPADATWTMDGVEITDMAAVGASPTYFNYDNFDEIQVSTSGQDIRARTGGVALNFVVKRGTNEYKGTGHGYFDNDKMEATNLPAERAALGITPDRADHNVQISDYGFELGGPIVKDRAWAFGSWSDQDIRLRRGASATTPGFVDRTVLKTSFIKPNWQATKKDNVSGLWYLGSKEKTGRSPGVAGLVDAPTATYNQGNAFPESRPHGLLKFADDHVVSSNVFVSGKYAYYGTGFTLAPAGGLDMQAGRSPRLGQSFGSVNSRVFLRPQHTVNGDASIFLNGWGASHDVRFGTAFRRTQSYNQNLWPGNMILALDNSTTDQRARVYREGKGTDQTDYFDIYVGDTISRSRATIDVGVRYDRQWGKALPSGTLSNKAFPNIMPGINFAGYDAPFTWNNVSPRAGLTYALDEGRKTIMRASFSRFAGQLDTGLVGFTNPSGNAGFADYPWVDLNGDHFAQANEVDTSGKPITFGGGFNPDNPKSVVSADRLDPNLKAPVTSSVVVGVDRELVPNLAVQVNYSYTRTSNWQNTYWNGVTLADYQALAPATGILPDGTRYSVPVFRPDPAKVAAGGNSLLQTNWFDYYSYFNGVEIAVVKRMSNKWMSRVGFSYNGAKENYGSTPRDNVANGNPTPTDTEPLNNGGQFVVRSSGSGAGDIFVNAKWQFNANAVYELPGGLEVAGNVFGRQGYPYPIFRQTSLGLDGSNRVLVTPAVDTIRLANLWNTDLRASYSIRHQHVNARFVADLFNVFNSNTELSRNRNAASTAFQQLTQNLSPRILRLGIVFGF